LTPSLARDKVTLFPPPGKIGRKVYGAIRLARIIAAQGATTYPWIEKLAEEVRAAEAYQHFGHWHWLAAGAYLKAGAFFRRT
jgi:hypothetical protein